MTAPVPSEHARSFIGSEVTVSSNVRGHSGAGTVLDVEFAGCTVTNDRGEWPGIRFRIKRANGSKFWTIAMPDEPPAASRETPS